MGKRVLKDMPQPFLQYDKKLETCFRFVELIAPGASDGIDAWVSPVFVRGTGDRDESLG